MNLDHVKIGLIIGIPVLLPPVLQYRYNISAPLVLGAIIACYLPLWYKLNYMNEEPERPKDSDNSN